MRRSRFLYNLFRPQNAPNTAAYAMKTEGWVYCDQSIELRLWVQSTGLWVLGGGALCASSSSPCSRSEEDDQGHLIVWPQPMLDGLVRELH